MKLSFTIRSADRADEKCIKALIRFVQINPLGVDWRRFIIAVDTDGGIVGCGQVKPHRDGSCELASIAVTKEWRGQGVARAMIEQLIADHPGPLWLTCASRLTPLYARFGFRQVTAAEHMPPYFRRASRLFNLYLRLLRKKSYLAVMVRPEIRD